MCRKFIVLISFAALTGLLLTSAANAADPNLLGWWKLDEGSGTTTADSSALGNDGTFGVDFNGLPDSNNAPQWVAGRRGEHSLKFYREDYPDFVNCGNDPNLDVNGPMTVMAWVKGVWPGMKAFVVTKGGDSWRLGFPKYYRPYWLYDPLDSPGQSLLGASTHIGYTMLFDDQWHHFAGTVTDSGIEFYFDGVLVDSNAYSGPFNTDTNNLWIGGKSTLDEKGEDYWTGYIDDVRIYNYDMNEAEIQAIYSEPYDIAHDPSPEDGAEAAVNLTGKVALQWVASPNAVDHNVYFGTSSPPPFIKNQAGTSYEPNSAFEEGGIDFGGTYYWQIEEDDANSSSLHKSPIWSFSVPDYIVIDDFEGYYSTAQLTDVWSPSPMDYVVINHVTGHDADKSMQIMYYNLVGFMSYMEADNTLDSATDLTSEGKLKALTLYFLGTDEDNGPDPLYVRLESSDGNTATVWHPNNPNAILETMYWQEWNIDLQDFKSPAQAASNDVNLTEITHIVIGIGDPCGPSSESQGIVVVDDVRLYPSRCILDEGPLGDIAGNGNKGDCKVDYKDVGMMSDDWLSGHPGLVLWYKLDETDGNIVHDSSCKGYDGTINAPDLWTIHGKIDGCMDFNNQNYIEVPLEALSSIEDEITIAFWANGNPNNPLSTYKNRHDCILHAKYAPDVSAKVLSIYFPSPNDHGGYSDTVCDMSNPDYYGQCDRIRVDIPQWRGSWNHFAFTKDVDRGVMTIYHNGDPFVSSSGMHQKIWGAKQYHEDETGLRIGMKLEEGEYVDGGAENIHWYVWGRLDDFRIYNYKLSDADIKRLYNQEALQDQRGDFDSSGRINFKDYAEVGNSWLEEQLWP